MNWLLLSLVTLVLWGVWTLLVKIATRFVDWKQYLVISTLAYGAVISILYLYFKPQINIHQAGFYYSFLAGIAAIASAITFYLALTFGKASVVIPLTALYPAIAVILAFLILQEKVSLFQALGIILALISIFLMSL